MNWISFLHAGFDHVRYESPFLWLVAFSGVTIVLLDISGFLPTKINLSVVTRKASFTLKKTHNQKTFKSDFLKNFQTIN